MTARISAAALAMLALAPGLSTPAAAHPHVWVQMRSDVVFNDAGLIAAMNVMWTFDAAYTQMALDGLDSNGDGVYSQDEIAPLAKENLKALKDYDYFTVMRFNGEKQPLGEVTEFGQIWSNNRLEMHFQVPLKTPLDPRKGEFMVKIYDPDFFVAIDYAKDEPVTVIGNMPAPCQLLVKPLPSDAEIDKTRKMLFSKGRDWKPDNNEDFGALFAQPVSIQCKA